MALNPTAPPFGATLAQFCLKTAALDQLVMAQFVWVQAGSVSQDISSVGGALTNLTQPVSQYCSPWIDVSTLFYSARALRVMLNAQSATSPFVHTDVQLTFASCSPAIITVTPNYGPESCSGNGMCAVNMSNLGIDAGYCACNAGFSGVLCEHRACAAPRLATCFHNARNSITRTVRTQALTGAAPGPCPSRSFGAA